MKLDVHGQSAYFYTGGAPWKPEQPGVVFVHGALHDHSVWILQSRYLAHHGHCVMAVDLPGHGRTPGPALSVEQSGQWLADLILASGLQQVMLVGHSMGSLIALEAGSLLGERVRRLVMVGTAYPMKVSPALLQMSLDDPLRAIDLVNSLSISTQAAKPSHPGPGFSLHGGNRALMRRTLRGYPTGNLFHHDFSACDAYNGLEKASARLLAPVTLVLGQKDQMTSPKAVAPLLQALKPEVVHLPCGHAIMAEAPDGLLDCLVKRSP
jgi:pimeloyl-ACP methyl ester carboxylesterase